MTPKNELRVNRQRSAWVLVFSFMLAVILLYIALQGVDWATFVQTIETGHYELVLITLPIASANYFIRSMRWSVLVRSEKTVPIISVFWANMVGYMGNTFLPARAGELLRSASLGQKTGLGTGFVLATAVIERVLDTLALVFIGAICVLGQANVPSVLDAVRVMAIAGILGLSIVLIVSFQEQFFLNLLNRIPLPSIFSQKISDILKRFLVGLRSLRSIRRMSLFVGLTLAIWLIDGVGNVIGARIISQSLTLSQALIFLAGLGLSSAIPSTPGYVGIYQFVAVTILVPFGFSRTDALAYILINQVLTLLTVGFWGLIGWWQINRDTSATMAAR